MALQWYIERDGQKFGPVSSAGLKAMADAGQISPTSRLWRDGFADWVEAGRVQTLFKPQAPAATPATPSPLPAGQEELAGMAGPSSTPPPLPTSRGTPLSQPLATAAPAPSAAPALGAARRAGLATAAWLWEQHRKATLISAAVGVVALCAIAGLIFSRRPSYAEALDIYNREVAAMVPLQDEAAAKAGRLDAAQRRLNTVLAEIERAQIERKEEVQREEDRLALHKRSNMQWMFPRDREASEKSAKEFAARINGIEAKEPDCKREVEARRQELIAVYAKIAAQQARIGHAKPDAVAPKGVFTLAVGGTQLKVEMDATLFYRAANQAGKNCWDSDVCFHPARFSYNAGDGWKKAIASTNEPVSYITVNGEPETVAWRSEDDKIIEGVFPAGAGKTAFVVTVAGKTLRIPVEVRDVPVKIGATADEIIKSFGIPDSTETVNDGTQHWRYKYWPGAILVIPADKTLFVVGTDAGSFAD